MLFRDLIEHYKITTPPEVIRYFLKRVMINLTKPTSVNNIYNELKSHGLKVSKDSLYLWLEYACKIITFNQSRLIEHNGLKIEVTPAFMMI